MAEGGYPRDLRGYGRNPPHPHWPGEARIAVQFVVNFEEGGENNILHGDRASEAFLSDVLGAQPWPGHACGLLAAMAYFHRAKVAGDRVRRGDRLEAKPGSGCRDERGGLGYRQPQP
jgi:hypothetical protein